MLQSYFLTQIHRKNGTFTKGVVVKDTLDEARQAYHAYLGAYGYGHDTDIDYVACYIADINGRITDSTVDNRIPVEPIETEGE